MKSFFNAFAIYGALLLGLDVHAQVPPMIHYQSRITGSGGAPFSGTGYFKFVLGDGGPPPVTYWSQDGTSVGGAEPATAIAAAVTSGVVSITLGDPSLMGVVPPSIFSHSPVYLRVWFSDKAGGSFVLQTPDIRIVSVPYAMMSASVVDNAITEGKLADGAVTARKLDANAISSTQLADGAVTTEKLADNSVTGTKLADQISLGAPLSDAGVLQIYSGGVSLVPSIKLDGGTGAIRASDSIFVGQTRLGLLSGSPTTNTQVSLTAESYGGLLRLYDEDETEVASLGSGPSNGGQLRLYQKNGSSGVSLYGDIYENDGGAILANNANGGWRVYIDGQDSNGGGAVQIANSAGSSTIKLDAEGSDGGGDIILKNDKSEQTIVLNGAEGSGKGGQILFYNRNGTKTIQMDGDDPDAGGWLGLYDTSGAKKIELDSNATGGARITTDVLEIKGGSDLSESFEIMTRFECEPTPGLVVSIDPEIPGHLVPSGKAYDKTVAGVMSGAGGVKPGMLMAQHGTIASGQHPVALAGRVYCQADASKGAIKPGDLLTTSDLPGHAMKVTDFVRAQGAIIGKAMSSLDSGQGLVLVLVSLQ